MGNTQAQLPCRSVVPWPSLRVFVGGAQLQDTQGGHEGQHTKQSAARSYKGWERESTSGVLAVQLWLPDVAELKFKPNPAGNG